MQETVTLDPQEQKRVLVLNQILAGHLSAAEAALWLHISRGLLSQNVRSLINHHHLLIRPPEPAMRIMQEPEEAKPQRQQMRESRLNPTGQHRLKYMRPYLASEPQDFGEHPLGIFIILYFWPKR